MDRKHEKVVVVISLLALIVVAALLFGSGNDELIEEGDLEDGLDEPTVEAESEAIDEVIVETESDDSVAEEEVIDEDSI